MSLWKIFRVFAEMGAVCFGGGYAMLSLVQRVVVEEHGWATEEELMDYYAIGQCTPGIIAVNVATFIGHKLRGLPGAIAASLGFISPSILIITVIAAFLESFASNVYVAHALAGIRVCVCVLILQAVLRLWKKSSSSRKAIPAIPATVSVSGLICTQFGIYLRNLFSPVAMKMLFAMILRDQDG